MSFFSSAKAKLAASKLAEEQLYALAAEEVASGQIRQGLWAKAIAETGGDDAAAKARYLKLRVEIMRAEFDVTHAASDDTGVASEKPLASGVGKVLIWAFTLPVMGLIYFMVFFL